ncbi:MAG TPA: hypothetical protein VN651_02170 [Gemmatimonadaceae bacterium]|nr:hypothetical protein [Gemmatimonadaceae bacterium]
MRILVTLFKIALGLAIAIPVGLFVMALTFGLIGTVVGLVAMAVRLAVFGLVGYGIYRVGRFFFAPRAGSPHARAAAPTPELASVDPYYAAAMRELDSELKR